MGAAVLKPLMAKAHTTLAVAHGSSAGQDSGGQGRLTWAQGTILHWRLCHEVWKPQLSELCLWWCLARTLGLLQAAPFSYRLEGLERK